MSQIQGEEKAVRKSEFLEATVICVVVVVVFARIYWSGAVSMPRETMSAAELSKKRSTPTQEEIDNHPSIKMMKELIARNQELLSQGEDYTSPSFSKGESSSAFVGEMVARDVEIKKLEDEAQRSRHSEMSEEEFEEFKRDLDNNPDIQNTKEIIGRYRKLNQSKSSSPSHISREEFERDPVVQHLRAVIKYQEDMRVKRQRLK